MTIPQALQLALQRHQAGRLGEAEALYREILAVQPNHAGALHFLGLIADQAGRHDLAVDLIRQSIVLSPGDPLAHFNLGNALRGRGQVEEAIGAFRRALQIKPDFPEALNSLGIELAGKGRFDEAMAAYRRTLQLRPDYPEAHNNLGAALAAQGQSSEAVVAYRRALQFKPDFPEALHNLGNALKGRGELDEAIAAYHRALQFKPDFPGAHLNLGVALRERGELEEAAAEFRRALELKADYPEAHFNLGNLLQEDYQFEEAVAEYRHALQLRPSYPKVCNNLGGAFMSQGELDGALAAFRASHQLEPENAGFHSNLIYALHFHPGHDARTISEEHERWNRQFSDAFKLVLQPHANDRDPGRRLRVGYVSPDFRDHPVGRFVLPLFECHDRDQFEIVCYSGVSRPDSMTERVRALAGEWRNTAEVPDARLAEMIREDHVDILVDLTMHTAGNRLPVFARQPAPVQVTWLAYPGSTGLPGIGYRLTDARMDPPGEKPVWSAEEPTRLPDCWCCYAPADESPEINALPALSTKFVTFGSLNNFAKVNERVLALWAGVLNAVSESRLLLFCPEGQPRERVWSFFGARGVAAERIELLSSRILPRWEYLALYHRIDLGLDPFPCNGMATTCDALWMGVPVLTLPGGMPISRAGLSLLSSVGLGELAASSEEDYLRIAVELAGDLPRLAEMRAKLRARMLASPLMDAPRFALNVESAYRSMWETWCSGRSGSAASA